MKIVSRLLLSLALMCSGAHLVMAADENRIYAVVGSRIDYRADIQTGINAVSDQIVESIFEGHNRLPTAKRACSPQMQARTIVFEGPLRKGGYDRIFNQTPERSAVVRRFGQAPSTVPSVKMRPMRQTSNHDDEVKAAEFDLWFKADLLICEVSGFVDLLGGSLSVTGTVGQYHVSFQHQIAANIEGIVSMQWERHSKEHKADPQLGTLKIVMSQNGLVAQARNSDRKIAAHFRMSLQKEISLSGDGE